MDIGCWNPLVQVTSHKTVEHQENATQAKAFAHRSGAFGKIYPVSFFYSNKVNGGVFGNLLSPALPIGNHSEFDTGVPRDFCDLPKRTTTSGSYNSEFYCHRYLFLIRLRAGFI